MCARTTGLENEVVVVDFRSSLLSFCFALGLAVHEMCCPSWLLRCVLDLV